jgi:Zn-dependent protease
MNLKNGGIRLFRAFGINVYLHWSWLLVAFLEISLMKGRYSQPIWGVLEYLSIFVIVLLHEYGHALACRSVGGRADTILLWPLGGVAYVDPPPRPGAMLWSIVAGPLVNVILLPVTIGLYVLTQNGMLAVSPDAQAYITYLAILNAALLFFNILPIYPLDGGKIVWSLLWFIMGQWKSLMVATVIGLIGGVAVLAAALWTGNTWFIVLAGFGTMNSWTGFKQARVMVRLNAGPKHTDFACPTCRAHPPMAALWQCPCGTVFDTFSNNGQCPMCGTAFPVTRCTNCGAAHPIAQWRVPAFPVTVSRGVVPPPIPISRG